MPWQLVPLILLPPALNFGVLEKVAQDAGVKDAFSRSGSGIEDAAGPFLAVQGMHAGLCQLRVGVEDGTQGKGCTVNLGLEDASSLRADAQVI